MFLALKERGILVRDVGIAHHLRVSAGTQTETSAFLDAMAELTSSRSSDAA
jgi:histidinol-phosphate aminotransferase